MNRGQALGTGPGTIRIETTVAMKPHLSQEPQSIVNGI